MIRIIVSKTINASAPEVFKAVSDISGLPETNPDIVKIEFFTDRKSGAGTRFRETRMMKGRESVTELEITELDENNYIRMITDSHGTVWDSIFTVVKKGKQTELTLTMDAKAHKLLPKIMNPLMKGMFKAGLEKHMDAVKDFCEK